MRHRAGGIGDHRGVLRAGLDSPGVSSAMRFMDRPGK